MLHCKHKNELMEEKIENKTEEIENSKVKCKANEKNLDNNEKKQLHAKHEHEQKIDSSNEALKLKSKKLIAYVKRIS